MERIPVLGNITNTKVTSKLKEIIMYIIKDDVALVTFFLLFLKSILMINVLESGNASKIQFQPISVILGNAYLHILFVTLFISVTYLFKKRAHLWSLVILDALVSVLFVGDLWYYRGFRAFLGPYVFGESKNLTNLSSCVKTMSRPVDIIFFADVIILLLFAILRNKKYAQKERVRGVFPILFLVPTLILLGLHFKYDFKDQHASGPVFFKTQWVQLSTLRNLTPLGFHVYDTISYFYDKLPYELTDADKKEIQTYLDYKNENLPANQYKGMFTGKNIIMIQVESLENFVINQEESGQEITPNINNLLKNSLYFDNYYEQIYNGNSSDADLMTHTSVLPIRNGSTFFRYPDNKYKTLPELLEKKGYYTTALLSDYGYYWNWTNAISNFGFNQVGDINSFPVKEIYAMGLTDESYFNQLLPKIDNQKQKPFFDFFITDTSHTPFKLPDNFKSLNLDKEFDETFMGSYLQSIHYTDKQIGNFLTQLDQRGYLDNSIVVIYGDHCGVHKYYPDQIAKIQPQESWWDNGGRIPLIIYSKGMEGKTISTIGGQVDLMPTIAYLMGVNENEYKNTTMGRNLLNTNRSYAILADGTIVGKENLTKKDIENINKSFDVADKITESDYFYKK